MPLVEVIRGEKTGEDAIARTVAYALAMGKKPVVVNDCPGFLVNRVLLPYFGAFMGLVRRGIDFVDIDRAMERFGWPMGPAYLSDVVGIDTGVHAGAVMAEGFPDRMKYDFKTCHDVMFENERYGQKNGRGYYAYEADKKGRPKKMIDDEVAALLAPVIEGSETLDEATIVDSMMVPMCLEAVRCLEDGIAASATDVDLALIYGIGFPPFRGGALHYIDDYGQLAGPVMLTNTYSLGTVRDSALKWFARNNLIHDVYAGGERCPGWGIYLGCETRDTKVTNNQK